MVGKKKERIDKQVDRNSEYKWEWTTNKPMNQEILNL